jgi:hypothetical protein
LAFGCLLAAMLACNLPGIRLGDDKPVSDAERVESAAFNAQVRATEVAHYDQFSGEQGYTVTHPGSVQVESDCQTLHETKGTPLLERKFNQSTNEIVLTDMHGSSTYTMVKPYTFCRMVKGRNDPSKQYSECVILYEHGFSIVVSPQSAAFDNINDLPLCNRLDYAEVDAEEFVLFEEEQPDAAPEENIVTTADCIADASEYRVEFRKEEQHGKDNRYNCLSFMTLTSQSSDPLWVYYYADYVTINNPRFSQWIVKRLEPGERIEPLAANDFAAYYMDHPSGIEYTDIGPLVAIRDSESCRGISPETDDLSAYAVDLDTLCPPE